MRSSRRSPRRHWASAACSESTGTSRSGSPLIRSTTRSPPTTRLSLLARASILPACSVARVGPSPAEPTSAFRTMSASESRASVSAASGPTCTSTPLIPLSFSCRSAAASSLAMATCGEQELADLAHEELLVGPRGQADDLEPVGVVPHDVERLRPHRSRRTEDHERAHRPSDTLRRPQTTEGQVTRVRGSQSRIRRR